MIFLIAALAIGSAYNKFIELISGVVANGTLNQCSKAIGCGKMDKSNALFSLACIIGMDWLYENIDGELV
ncbi:MAG: hypothetical protein K5897_02950 [Eubacterium sp.]|nr:hypothetical protein [Eubacterium sp.]